MHYRVTICTIWCITSSLALGANIAQLSAAQINEIGKKIWKNECNGSKELLAFWNPNEQFPSFGIGHFIWFPANCSAPFTQTFPELLTYLEKHMTVLPEWLTTTTTCPWNTRTEFYAPASQPRLNQLRTLLADTIGLQAQFIVEQLHRALPNILSHTPPNRHAHITANFNTLAETPRGCFALIDYLNFKGDGTNAKERYAGHGWGLLQVLDAMNTQSADPVHAFSSCARKLLEQRVTHAPDRATEQRFLPGWINRISSY